MCVVALTKVREQAKASLPNLLDSGIDSFAQGIYTDTEEHDPLGLSSITQLDSSSYIWYIYILI